MKWLDNKYSRHAVIYGALSPPCPPTPRPPGFPAWHLSLRVDFLLMPGLMLLWMPGCSRGPQMHHKLPSKLSARATKNVVRKRCLTASKELEQPLAVIHYWHRDTEVPRNAVMTWAPYLMDYNQHNVWQYLTTIQAQWWKFYSQRGRILYSKEREYFN